MASRLKFQYCTPFRNNVCPMPCGERRNSKAQTGTGKTAAFLAAAFSYLLRHPGMAQTQARVALGACTYRELAIQIHKDAEDLGKYCGSPICRLWGMGTRTSATPSASDRYSGGTPGESSIIARGHLHLSEAESL